ncbi:MAG: hypothetical protein HDQ93_01135 [Desulfovibrio sp.]|nr:hypothetical protein [Desulfovibrio sp.]
MVELQTRRGRRSLWIAAETIVIEDFDPVRKGDRSRMGEHGASYGHRRLIT